jgi:hypothetical protein
VAPQELSTKLYRPGEAPAQAGAFNFFWSRQKALKPFKVQEGETPEQFVARHPWIPKDTKVVNWSKWDSDDFFSPQFRLQDEIDIGFKSNEAYVGEWKFAHFGSSYDPVGNDADGYLYVVTPPTGPVTLAWLQSQTVLPERPNNSKDVTWRGIRFNPNGTVDVDVGTRVKGLHTQPDYPGDQWTDGYIINRVEKTLAPIFLSEDKTNRYLWIVIRNGDYDAGFPPQWLVFKRPK